MIVDSNRHRKSIAIFSRGPPKCGPLLCVSPKTAVDPAGEQNVEYLRIEYHAKWQSVRGMREATDPHGCERMGNERTGRWLTQRRGGHVELRTGNVERSSRRDAETQRRLMKIGYPQTSADVRRL